MVVAVDEAEVQRLVREIAKLEERAHPRPWDVTDRTYDALLGWAKDKPRGDGTRREVLDRYVGIVLASNEVFRFLEQNRASVQSMDAGKERFARVRIRLDALVDLLVGSDAPLRDRVRATTAVLSVGATCMFFVQEVDDRDKLRAIVLEMATDLIS